MSEVNPRQAAERLAYSVDEVAQITGLSRDLLSPVATIPYHADPRWSGPEGRPTSRTVLVAMVVPFKRGVTGSNPVSLGAPNCPG